MGINSEYYKEKNKKRLTKLKEIEKALPPYVVSYLDDKELSSQINTVIAYAYDMQTFLKFLTERNTLLKNTAIKDISIDFLENLTFEVPSFDEQAKIGEHFSNLDHLITLHQRQHKLHLNMLL